VHRTSCVGAIPAGARTAVSCGSAVVVPGGWENAAGKHYEQAGESYTKLAKAGHQDLLSDVAATTSRGGRQSVTSSLSKVDLPLSTLKDRQKTGNYASPSRGGHPGARQ
jgi:hypothetical protein